jgi:hypothetical protein
MMNRETLIKKTLDVLSKLPPEKVSEIADFAEYLMKKYDDEILQKGMEKIISDSESFNFLKTEEDIYTLEDLKEKYQ